MAEYTFQYTKPKTKVVIGDAVSFKPKTLFRKFDDFHYFSLELEGVGLFIPTVSVDGKIEGKAIDKDFSITYSQTGLVEGFNDEGGLDIVITTGKDASNNVLSFTFDSQNVVGYLQPPLTPEEIAEGCIRPDHVINSIALYCTDKGGSQETGGIEWKTGKVGHLYRMKATSYDGKVDPVWCDWSISGNVYNLTIPSDWYNDKKTKFPITIAPVGDTFGITSVGASDYSGAGDSARGNLRALGTAGTGTSMTWYCPTSTSDDGDSVMCIYNDSLVLKGQSAPITPVNANQPDAGGWNTVNFISNPALAVDSYYLMHWGEEFSIAFDAGVNNVDDVLLDNAATGYPGTLPDPITILDGGLDSILSIYCTYTPSGGTAWTKNLSDSFSISDSISKAFGQVQSDSMAVADVIGNAPSKNLVDSVSITDSFDRTVDYVRVFNDLISITDSLAKESGLNLTDTLAIADSINIIKFLNIILNDTVTIGDAIAKGITLTKSDTQTITDGLVKFFGMNKSDAVILADSISKSVSLNKADTVTINDVIGKTIGLFKAETLAIADDIAKSFQMVRSDAIAIVDTFSRTATYLRSLADNVNITDSISKFVSVIKADTVTITDTMTAIMSGIAHVLNLFDTVVITDSITGILRVKTYLRQQISRLDVARMNVSRMTVKRMQSSRIPLFRWIIRRFP